MGGWLVKHMEWDFDDVDPQFPLSPYFRFVSTWRKLLRTPITFTTVIRPTTPQIMVSAGVNPFPPILLEANAVTNPKKPIGMPYLNGYCQLSIPFKQVREKITGIFPALKRADTTEIQPQERYIDHVANTGFVGLRADIHQHLEPTVGVINDLKLGNHPSLGYLAGCSFTTRIWSDSKGEIQYTSSLRM
ncbi:hypothetical protein GUITHDRAFT_162580, partial [Guillardia theta CCMP2712]